MKARYSVVYVGGADTWKPYALVHAAKTDKLTLCGKEITPRWFISHNDYDGTTTCPQCKKLEEAQP